MAVVIAPSWGLVRPQPPTAVTGTGGNAQVSVAFTPPVYDGGGAETSYVATSSPGGFTQSGSSSPLVVTGLTNGTAYTFTVTATNTYGTSLASSASGSVTPAVGSTPALVAGQTARVVNTGVNVNSVAPAFTNFPSASNTIVVFVGYNDTTVSVGTVSCTGATFTLALRQTASGRTSEIWYGSGGTAKTVTVTLASAGVATMHAVIAEFTNIVTSSVTDGTPLGNLQTSPSPVSTSSMTPTQTNNLCVAMWTDDGDASIPTVTVTSSGWNKIFDCLNTNASDNMSCAYAIPNNTSAQQCTWTHSLSSGASFSNVIAILKHS